jgi:hypothetical protein
MRQRGRPVPPELIGFVKKKGRIHGPEIAFPWDTRPPQNGNNSSQSCRALCWGNDL